MFSHPNIPADASLSAIATMVSNQDHIQQKDYPGKPTNSTETIKWLMFCYTTVNKQSNIELLQKSPPDLRNTHQKDHRYNFYSTDRCSKARWHFCGQL